MFTIDIRDKNHNKIFGFIPLYLSFSENYDGTGNATIGVQSYFKDEINNKVVYNEKISKIKDEDMNRVFIYFQKKNQSEKKTVFIGFIFQNRVFSKNNELTCFGIRRYMQEKTIIEEIDYNNIKIGSIINNEWTKIKNDYSTNINIQTVDMNDIVTDQKFLEGSAFDSLLSIAVDYGYSLRLESNVDIKNFPLTLNIGKNIGRYLSIDNGTEKAIILKFNDNDSDSANIILPESILIDSTQVANSVVIKSNTQTIKYSEVEVGAEKRTAFINDYLTNGDSILDRAKNYVKTHKNPVKKISISPKQNAFLPGAIRAGDTIRLQIKHKNKSFEFDNIFKILTVSVERGSAYINSIEIGDSLEYSELMKIKKDVAFLKNSQGL